MNVRNQMDEALDAALETHLQKVFKDFFGHGDEVRLGSELRSADAAYKKASKALDKYEL
jgi:hypothetical protein